MPALRIATCRPLPEPDPDEALLLQACHEVGIEAQMVAWHEPTLWQGDHLQRQVPVLIRSTWDYIHRLKDFERWLQSVSEHAPIWNAWGVIRHNLHKRYLLSLATQGVPTTPSLLAPQGSLESLADKVAAVGWRDVVIKPAVSAGSFDTHRLSPGDSAAEAQWRQSVSMRDMLIQPYLTSVDDEGERALVWIDGEFTHAVRKSPRFAADIEQVSAALPISQAERALGEAALQAIGSDDPAAGLLYARVDVARDAEGEWRVMELELIEPSLFLAQYPPALQRLVSALQQRLIA